MAEPEQAKSLQNAGNNVTYFDHVSTHIFPSLAAMCQSATAMPTQQRCGASFLNLPKELRKVIYQWYFDYTHGDFAASRNDFLALIPDLALYVAVGKPDVHGHVFGNSPRDRVISMMLSDPSFANLNKHRSTRSPNMYKNNFCLRNCEIFRTRRAVRAEAASVFWKDNIVRCHWQFLSDLSSCGSSNLPRLLSFLRAMRPHTTKIRASFSSGFDASEDLAQRIPWKILQLVLRGAGSSRHSVDGEQMLEQIRREWVEHLYHTGSQLAYSASGVAGSTLWELWRSEPEGDRIKLFGLLGRLDWKADVQGGEGANFVLRDRLITTA